MSERFQQQESAAAPVAACVDDFSAKTFDHRVDRFHLPTLSVTTFVQMTFHLSSISARRFAGGRSPVRGGDQCLNSQLVPRQLVIGFAVETGVRGDGFQPRSGVRFAQQGLEVAEVGPRPLAGPSRQDEMTRGLAGQAQLRITVIDHPPFSPVFSSYFPPLGEVATGMSRLESTGVDCRQADAAAKQLRLPGPLDRRGQQTPERGYRQQAIGRLLQRREVRDFFQSNRLGQRIAVCQQADRAAIGQIVKVLQHQTGKQLMLRECLGTEPMRIRRQRSFGHPQRLDQNPLRTFARLHPFPYEPHRTEV